MPKFIRPRAARVTAGLAVVAAVAATPIAAHAADTDATGTLTAGSLTNTAPAITPFTAALTGVTQTVTTAVGAWSVTDARGNSEGYSVTVSATAPTVNGEAADAGHGASLSLTPTTATAATGNPATTGPVAQPAGVLPVTGVAARTIQFADTGTGQGEWDFAADAGAEENLAVVIPGDASAGDYSSTLTFTSAGLAG
jgi:hypothetical protein